MINIYIVEKQMKTYVEKLLNKTILIFSVNTVSFNLAIKEGDYNSTV